jgi:hypothetical protein
MNKLLSFLMVGALLLAPTTLFAADGDGLTDVSRNKGVQNVDGGIIVCDTKAAADDGNPCTAVDLGTLTLGGPHVLILEIESFDDCSAAYTVAVQTRATTTSTLHEISTPAVALDAVTTRVTVDLTAASIDRYLVLTPSTLTDCTDLTVCGLWTSYKH